MGQSVAWDDDKRREMASGICDGVAIDDGAVGDDVVWCRHGGEERDPRAVKGTEMRGRSPEGDHVRSSRSFTGGFAERFPLEL